jgi:hypothetical protein
MPEIGMFDPFDYAFAAHPEKAPRPPVTLPFFRNGFAPISARAQPLAHPVEPVEELWSL